MPYNNDIFKLTNILYDTDIDHLNIQEAPKFLLRSMKNVKKVFYSSSACVYPEYNQLDPDNPKCTEDSTYPAEPHDINLNTINALKSEYKCDVGYSGHENGVVISVAASTLGISSLERHITLDRTMYGSDQAASLELSGFRNMINSINKIHLAFGEEKIGHITDEEKKISKKLRQHIN